MKSGSEQGHGGRVVVFGWIVVLIFFGISLTGVLYPPLDRVTARIANRNYNGEGLIELIEAASYLLSFFLFLFIFSKYLRPVRWGIGKLYFLMLPLLCLVAFGEEISWGQHLFSFNPPEVVKTVNKQNELNLHNLNLSQILQISKSHFSYKYFENITRIINPLYYLFCALLWCALPALRKLAGHRITILQSLPALPWKIIVFAAINIAAYLIIDKLFFDIGEIFELALSLLPLMAAIEYLEKKPFPPVLAPSAAGRRFAATAE